MTLLRAMATQEGFYIPGSRASRNNNPGNIDMGPFAKAHGATRLEEVPHGYNEKPRFAYFPDVATGFACMKALLQRPQYRGLTVRAMLNEWAPSSDGNDVSAYENDVCTFVPCQPTNIIDPLVEVGV